MYFLRVLVQCIYGWTIQRAVCVRILLVAYRQHNARDAHIIYRLHYLEYLCNLLLCIKYSLRIAKDGLRR